MEEKEEITEVELNEDGVPRPAPDPKNGLYTVICLALFFALYFGYRFIGENFFVPYTVTLTEFSERCGEILSRETDGIIPESASLSYARLSSGTDDDRLYIRYEIPDREAFEEYLISENFITDNADGEEKDEERLPVYKNEYGDVDYVYGNVYASAEHPDSILRVYGSDGRYYAEIVKTKYDSAVKLAFESGDKIKYKG